MSDDNQKRLTGKQQLFVTNYASGKSGVDSVKAANYNVANNNSASAIASQLLSLDHVQEALQIAIASEYPDIHKVSARTIYGILNSETSTATEKLRAIETLAKVFNWFKANEPKAEINSTRNLFRLPEE